MSWDQAVNHVSGLDRLQHLMRSGFFVIEAGAGSLFCVREIAIKLPRGGLVPGRSFVVDRDRPNKRDSEKILK